MKTDQVGRLHFQGAATATAALRAATRALSKLQGLGLIQPLQRRIGGVRAGSTSYVWALRTAGALLLNSSERKSLKSSRLRTYEPGYIFLKHTLAVTEVYVRLYTTGGVELVTAELEPACWRGHIAAHGGITYLKPDLYAVTTVGGYEDHWFLEVDLDTEAPSRVIRKCEHYRRYHLTGEEQKQIGVFPRVVWIVPDAKRRQTLWRYIRKEQADYLNLFAVITLADLAALIRTGVPPGVISQA
jgi:hypothetical protein